MKAMPKVSNVQGINLLETAAGGVLKNFSKSTGKHLSQSIFLNKLHLSLQPYQKEDSGTSVFH